MAFLIHRSGGLGVRKHAGATSGTLKAAVEARHRESEAFLTQPWVVVHRHGVALLGRDRPRGAALLRKLDKTIAGHLQGWPRKTAIRLFRQRMVARLMAFVGQQLLSVEDALPLVGGTGGELPDATRLSRNQPFLTPEELESWES